MRKYFGILIFLIVAGSSVLISQQQYYPIVPLEKRGDSQFERSGIHDANNIRTQFHSFGMVGGLADADVATKPSVEVPKGTGMSYSDGITPFVLAKFKNDSGKTIFIMENGYREGLGSSRKYNRFMRFEPRPGYFNPNPAINNERSPAVSTKPQTWPSSWPDKDSTFTGKWNGYFGTSLAFAPDQESFSVMDDQYYDAFNYTPDKRDATRQGLGLKIEVRGFQWANPQAGNVIFWHYDIANEGTTDYPINGDPENIIFGLYMDTGVGKGPNISCEGDENNDDAAKFDLSSGLDLVYTWDAKGRGSDLISNCSRTGYLGYAYLETPGKPYDLVDNDDDGISDERRDSLSGPGKKIIGKQNILSEVQARYNIAKFETIYGKITDRPAYNAGIWWTGDEDLDWTAELSDFGADGEPGSHDFGEKDSIPTYGEPNFNKTDLHESDQVGLTGFRMFLIAEPPQGDGGISFSQNPNAKQTTVQTKYEGDYPHYFYDYFTGNAQGPDAGPFSSTSTLNLNIGFLFASGPFTLKTGTQERFSLALAYGSILPELINAVKVVQVIYNGNYKFATPPPTPTLKAEAGDGYVQLHWNDVAEFSTDPTTYINDFEGYKIYRATDYNFNDVNTIISARGLSQTSNGNPLAQFDLIDGYTGSSAQVVNGLAYNLGINSGLSHTFRDTSVVNGQEYYYAVTSYDFGATQLIPGKTGEAFTFYPAENSISVSRTLLGGVTLPKNVVAVRPNPKVLGYKQAATSGVTKISGNGTGTVSVNILNSALVPSDHIMKITFNSNSDSVHPISYNLIDSTDNNKILFNTGNDFDGEGTGISEFGIQPVIKTLQKYQVDSANTKFVAGSKTDAQLLFQYKSTFFGENVKREMFPESFTIKFSDTIVDTALEPKGGDPFPVKFTIVRNTPSGEKKVPFSMYDFNGDSTLSYYGNTEEVRILTGSDTLFLFQRETWTIKLKDATDKTITPTKGDVFEFKLLVPFNSSDVFVFKTSGEAIASNAAKVQFKDGPYVVPNPYVGAASFEPAPFGVQGRGDRRMEFRNIPLNSTVRIYTVRGELVQTLIQDGSTNGYIPWNLRTKDNLDVAPGLYIFQVDAGAIGNSIGKFAIIK